MKEIFSDFFNFFQTAKENPQRSGQKAENRGQNIRQTEAAPQHRRGQQQKIRQPAAEHSQHHIDANVPVPRCHCVAEQRRQHQQPVGQVKERPHHPPAQPKPGHPKQVIQQAAQGPQHQSAEKGGGLVGIGEGHYRNSRDNRIPVGSEMSS